MATFGATCRDCGHPEEQHAIEYPASDRWPVCYGEQCYSHVFRAKPTICPHCGEQRDGEEEFIAGHRRCWTCTELAAEMLGLVS